MKTLKTLVATCLVGTALVATAAIASQGKNVNCRGQPRKGFADEG
jgi:hypothetical protein